MQLLDPVALHHVLRVRTHPSLMRRADAVAVSIVRHDQPIEKEDGLRGIRLHHALQAGEFGRQAQILIRVYLDHVVFLDVLRREVRDARRVKVQTQRLLVARHLHTHHRILAVSRPAAGRSNDHLDGSSGGAGSRPQVILDPLLVGGFRTCDVEAGDPEVQVVLKEGHNVGQLVYVDPREHREGGLMGSMWHASLAIRGGRGTCLIRERTPA
mmetsp:Transcript_80990/g.225386  ORF Transcript_80990/g.225386 Transcript_80990/m.225386 type:complete len:212 (+) Transcript_80990:671-1306(+)